MVDLLSQGSELVRNHLPLEQWPYLTHTALAAVGLGLILSLWGARLLRLVYVLGFMVAGAVVGIEVARINQVDMLVGLVLGAGLTGLIGYVLYRWWVGLTAGAIAMLFVMMVSGPKILPAEIQAFHNQHLGTGEYVLPDPSAQQAGQTGSVGQFVSDMKSYMWDARRDLVYRMLVVLTVAGIIGLVIGLILPRFTTIVGTTLIGVFGLAVGAGLLIWSHLPALWAFVQGQAAWFLIGVCVYVVGAMIYQLQNSRLKPTTVVPAA